MTLLLFCLVVLAIQFLFNRLDRGAREHRRWLRTPRQAVLADAVARAEKARLRVVAVSEAGWHDSDSPGFRRFVSTLVRARSIFGAHLFVLCLIVAGSLAGKLPFVAEWVAALAVAALLACADGFQLRALRRRGVIAAVGPDTRASTSIEWSFRALAAVSCFGSLSILYTGALPAPLLAVLPHGLRAGIEPWSTSTMWVWFVVGVAYVLALVATALERLGIRLAALKQRVTFRETTDETTMLYLRSFQDDAGSLYSVVSRPSLRTLLLPRTRFEEFLALSLLKEGNLVCIGNPREVLPLVGAQRVYYRPRRDAPGRSEEWKEAVEATARKARMVVLAAGTTTALAWEVGRLKEWELLNKCVFVFPPDSDSGTTERLTRLLTALELPTHEIERARQIPPSLICAVALRGRRQRPEYCLANGPDFLNYKLVLEQATAAIDNLSGKVVVRDRDDAARHRPRLPKWETRRVMTSAMSALSAFRKHDCAVAQSRLEAVLLSQNLDAMPAEVKCFLLHWYGLILGEVGDMENAVSALWDAQGTASSLDWVWLSVSEAKPTAQFRFDCGQKIVELLSGSVDGAMAEQRRDAALLTCAMAEAMDDRRRSAEAHGLLGAVESGNGRPVEAEAALAVAARLRRQLADDESATHPETLVDAGESAATGSTRTPVEGPRERPARPVKGTRRAISNTASALAALKTRDHAAAEARFEAVLATQNLDAAHPETECFLLYWYGVILGQAGDTDNAVSALWDAQETASSIDWAWVSMSEVKPTAQFRFDCGQKIVELLSGSVDDARAERRRDAERLMRDMAESMDDHGPPTGEQ
jgi:tetratricopeptide (TPR) repeat protein